MRRVKRHATRVLFRYERSKVRRASPTTLNISARCHGKKRAGYVKQLIGARFGDKIFLQPLGTQSFIRYSTVDDFVAVKAPDFNANQQLSTGSPQYFGTKRSHTWKYVSALL